MVDKLFKPHVQSTDVYIPPNSVEPNQRRLFLNENLLGCPVSCLEVLKNLTPEDLMKYAEGDSKLLKEAIAKKYGVNIGNILVHQGESDLLKQIFQAFLSNGDKVLTSRHSWSYYKVLAELEGADVANFDLVESEQEFSFDVEDIIEKIRTTKPKIVVLISPNMPTGNSLEPEGLKAILAEAESSIVVLDEAYYGFGDNEKDCTDENLQELLSEYPNLIITRTFSKLFALASLRVGYAFCNEKLQNYIQKTAPLFGISILSQLVAKEALAAEEYYETIRQAVVGIRNDFATVLDGVVPVYRSDANFVLVKLGEEKTDALREHLGENGFLVRSCVKYDLPDFLRISLGTQEDMVNVARLIRQYFNHTLSDNSQDDVRTAATIK